MNKEVKQHIVRLYCCIAILSMIICMNILALSNLKHKDLELSNDVEWLNSKVEALDDVDESMLNVVNRINENDKVLYQEISNLWCVLLQCE